MTHGSAPEGAEQLRRLVRNHQGLEASKKPLHRQQVSIFRASSKPQFAFVAVSQRDYSLGKVMESYTSDSSYLEPPRRRLSNTQATLFLDALGDQATVESLAQMANVSPSQLEADLGEGKCPAIAFDDPETHAHRPLLTPLPGWADFIRELRKVESARGGGEAI